jgi:uncharacterized protein (TIGR04222 family)
MNPFDLHGTDFLLFYLVLSVVLTVVLVLQRRLRETGPPPSLQLDDPYLLACLSRGPQEVIRVSTISLVDRGFLQISKGVVSRAAESPTIDPSQPEIEREVVSHFLVQQSLKSAFDKSTGAMESAKRYEEKLQQYGLVPDSDSRRTRWLWTGLTATVLFLVGAAKVVIAIERGHLNVFSLIVLTPVAAIVAVKIGNPYRTRRGDAYLASVRALFTDLKGRAKSLHRGGGTKELLWLAALFGMSAVPAVAFPFITEFPIPQTGSGSSCSSCSSGCGSGCGGGCGGCGS